MSTAVARPYISKHFPLSLGSSGYIYRTFRQRQCPPFGRIHRCYGQAAFREPPRRSAYPSDIPPPPSKPKYLRWVLGGLFISVITGYFSYSSAKGLSDPFENAPLIVPDDVSDRYKQTAPKFDDEVGMQEAFMGLGWLRWWLTRKAEGNVLEVSVGTGRNSSYYRLSKCQSISMVDQSPEMIEIAKAKFKKEHSSYKSCRFVTQSALDSMIAPPGGFDTVIQTMGLCSTPHPVELLQRMGSITNPDTGKIFLLEHGRSHYDWLNRILDSGAPQHADKHGCWWNKDIGKIVEESGLEVAKLKRYHFGTTWWVELRPRKK